MSQNFAESLADSLSSKLKVLDISLGESAFRSNDYENPYNLTTKEAKIIGAAIGCDYFILIKSATLRRSSFEKPEYYEAFAAVYIASARSGRLVFWKLNSFEAENAEKAERKLLEATNDLASEIAVKIKITGEKELSEKPVPRLEELPDEKSPDARNFRSPLPYKRFRPEYTRLANLYGVEATVDIEIDLDENGKILRTEVTRWAGFGLDESVIETIHKMQWRAASRNGKTLPIRVLLRYNFKKIEKDE